MSDWTILLESVAREIRAAVPQTHEVAVQRTFRTHIVIAAADQIKEVMPSG